MKSIAQWLSVALAILFSVGAGAETPWGGAQVAERSYQPQKVVYDVAVKSEAGFTSVLDRASYLSKLYQADPFESSIVLVLHGEEINYFARKNFDRYEELMRRVQSLTVGTTIEFRMCQIAARGHGYEPDDIYGFVQMVPMADAEIVRLQNEAGYAYMR